MERDGQSPLGARLRQRRQDLGLTLQQVADAAGFSVGFISQIERGITTPSLTSLVAVSRVLGADIGSFLQSPSGSQTVTRRSDRETYGLGDHPGTFATYERLSASFDGGILRSTLIHEPPGLRSEPMSHEGEEIFYIVKGELSLEIDGEVHVLAEGDSAHFPSWKVHSVWNHTDQPATAFHTCTIDVFGDEGAEPDGRKSTAITRASGRGRGAEPDREGENNQTPQTGALT